MVKSIFYVFVLFISISGCVSIPEDHQILGSSGEVAASIDVTLCEELLSGSIAVLSSGSTAMLDSRKIRLVNWNSYKGQGEKWQDDLIRLMQAGDILTLQEGYLTAELEELLGQYNFYWDMATAFRYKKIPNGVLTAARVRPDFLCSFRIKEQLSGLPKTVLITRYPLAGSDKSLLLVNIHMVNLSYDTTIYRQQLEATAEAIAGHPGPLILSGDFNTWSKERQAILDIFIAQLELKTALFSMDDRSLFLGHPVDHVFYRGLVQLEAFIKTVTTSDHNPMQVTFRVSDEQ